MEYIGIDISQAYVDVDLPSGVRRLTQTQAGHAALVAALPAGSCGVVEATGPYGARLLAVLHAAGQAVCVVNPLQVRRFAQSQLRRSKTDRADAQLLSQFGRAFTPPLHQPPGPVVEPVAAASGPAGAAAPAAHGPAQPPARAGPVALAGPG